MAKNLKCSVCGKAFALPAHLGRHMSAMHGRASAGGKKRGRRKGRRMRSAAVAMVATGAFPDVAGTLRAAVDQLVAQRSQIDSQLSALQGALKSLGGAPSNGAAMVRRRPGRRPGRPKGRKAGRRRAAASGAYRSGSLNDYILRVLRQSGATMTIADIEKAVLRSGYKTKSKKLANAINNTMGKLKGAKRVSRGTYRAG